MYKNIVVQDFHYVKLQQHNLYVNVGWSYQFLLSSKRIENIKLSYIKFMHIRVMKVLKNFEYHHWHSLKSKLDYL